MNNFLQIFYQGSMTLLLGFICIHYLKDYFKTVCNFKAREEILKVVFATFINFLTLTIRSVLEANQISTTLICYLFILEVFLDLFIFITLLKLFYYIRTKQTNSENKKNLLKVFSDLFIWIFLSAIIGLSVISGETSKDFIFNLRLYYLLPYSLLIFSVFVIVPKGMKVFREMKLSFLILSIVFLFEYLSKHFGFFNERIIYESIFSVKFFLFVSLAFNFYRMTSFVLPATEEETGCKE